VLGCSSATLFAFANVTPFMTWKMQFGYDAGS
jgi:hypothetical protein